MLHNWSRIWYKCWSFKTIHCVSMDVRHRFWSPLPLIKGTMKGILVKEVSFTIIENVIGAWVVGCFRPFNGDMGWYTNEYFLSCNNWSCLMQSSSHMALVRCFQLAFSLRSISLDKDGEFEIWISYLFCKFPLYEVFYPYFV